MNNLEKVKDVFEKNYRQSPGTKKAIRQKAQKKPRKKKSPVMPSGYELDKTHEAIVRVSTSKEGNLQRDTVISQPLKVSALYRNVETKAYKVGLKFKTYTGDTQELITDYLNINKRTELVKLSEYGLAVNDTNSNGVIKYLNSYISENKATLETRPCINHLGYTGGNFIPYDTNFTLENRQEYTDLIEGLRQGGVKGNSEQLLEEFYRNSSVNAIVICASLSGLLLELLGVNTYICHFYGQTGNGKTTFLKFLISMYGHPEKLKFIMNDTDNSFIKKLGFFCNLPVHSDELTVRGQERIDSFLYMLTEEKEKSRLNSGINYKLAEASGHWRTSIVTNGERELLTEASNSGTVNRVIELEENGLLFPKEYIGAEVNDIIDRNYGYIAEDFITYLRLQDRADLKKRYFNIIRELTNDILTKVYPEKQLNIVAVILLTSELLSELYPFIEPLQRAEVLKHIKTREETDLERRAFNMLRDTLQANSYRFNTEISECWGYCQSDRLELNNKVFTDIVTSNGASTPKALRKWLGRQGYIKKYGKNWTMPRSNEKGARYLVFDNRELGITVSGTE